MNAIGARPFFIEYPNGEFGGFELDTIRIMAGRVGARVKVERAYTWWDEKVHENGTKATDEEGNPIYIGPLAEIMYKMATFGVSEHNIVTFKFRAADFLVTSTQTYYYRTAKPNTLPPRWNLIKPFSITAWICILAALPTIMIFYSIFVHFYSKLHHENDTKTWFDNVMSVYMHQFSQSKFAYKAISEFHYLLY